MTVEEFQAILTHLPGEMRLVIAKDAEGNAFSTLDECGIEQYDPTQREIREFETFNTEVVLILWPAS